MNLLRRISVYITIKNSGILIATVLLFGLYIYPYPRGFVFSIIRIILLLTVAYLFMQLYQNGSSLTQVFNRQHNLDKNSTFSPLISEEIDLPLNEESQLLINIRYLLDIIVASNPRLNVAVYLQNNFENILNLKEFSGKENNFKQKIGTDNSLIKELINSKKIRVITPDDDREIFQQFLKDLTYMAESTSLFIDPIISNRSGVGILIAQADQFSDFRENDERTINLITEMIGKEVIQYHSITEIQSDNLFYKHLHAFQNKLDISRSKDDLIESVLRFCGMQFVFDKLTISLLNKDKEKAVITAVSGFTMDCNEGDTFSLQGTVHGMVIKDDKTIKLDNMVMNSDIKGRFTIGDKEEYQFLSFLGVPIHNNQGVIGSLVLESFVSKKYTGSDKRMLEIIADRFGILADWWNEYGVVSKSARFDGLTNLLNHNSFLKRFETEIARASRYQEHLVFMILDLDKFKRINDTHGHLYGDYVLAETASRLKQNVRNIDVVARYGGEEFTIILINTTKSKIISRAKRTVESIAKDIFMKDDITVNLTISAGIAEYPADGQTIQELISVADEMMYKVKHRGGNDVGVPNITIT